MRGLLPTISILGAGYLVMCLFYFLVQDRLIFLPTPELTPRAAAEPVRLERTDATLHGYRVNPPGDVDVVYFGGNAEPAAANARRFEAVAGARTLLLDYRGYGRSSGRPSQTALVDDAIAAVHALTDPERPLVLVGRSLGSGVAALAAASLGQRVDALVLISPFCSFRNVVALHAPAWLPSRWLLRHPFDVAVVAGALPQRIAVVIALEDEIVPPAESRCLVTAAGVPADAVFELPGLGHNDVFTADGLWAGIERVVGSLRQ
jgi:fermentation-respiration switch protein FrsA (DUF1100 family)